MVVVVEVVVAAAAAVVLVVVVVKVLLYPYNHSNNRVIQQLFFEYFNKIIILNANLDSFSNFDLCTSDCRCRRLKSPIHNQYQNIHQMLQKLILASLNLGNGGVAESDKNKKSLGVFIDMGYFKIRRHF